MQETTMFDQPETSPWGEIQRCVPICHGVYQVSTASHGGVMLPVRLKRAPAGSETAAISALRRIARQRPYCWNS